ncbi:hypothetical protein N9D99_06060 [Gammaproteobacteria bacterium]|nr:hypothetical protein [Gammaproteobacteria bacterium]
MMETQWDYYVSSIITDPNEKSKNAEKLEVMMRKQGLSNWELVNVVPSGNNALYAIYKKPIN